MNIEKENKQLAQLYEEMHQRLYIYALSALGDESLAQETVQDSFRIACVKEKYLELSENPKGYIMNILKNVINNARRHRASSQKLLVQAYCKIPKENGSIEEDYLDIYYGDLIDHEDYQLLKKVILNKYTMKEAAKELDISLEACKKRVQRAKKKLKEILENN